MVQNVPYQLDKSIFDFRGVGLYMYFHFIKNLPEKFILLISETPVQTQHNATSYQGLHCFQISCVSSIGHQTVII